MKDKKIGKYIVPIVPDESRTFGMDPLFRQCGIYAHAGQLYEPVDSDQVLYYREAEDGQILEEGITEAGSMSSFIAAGTAYSAHGVPMIPMFIYYSMFGFLVDEAVHADALETDGVQHARRRLDNPRRGVPLAFVQEQALDGDAAERGQVDDIGVLDAVAEAAAGRDERVLEGQ